MKVPGTYIRQALYSLLYQNVDYPFGTKIPVFEGEGGAKLLHRIIIGDYSDSSAGDKDSFRSRARQVIEVVQESNTATRKAVDEIGTLVATHIQPTVRSNALSSAEMQVMVMGKPDLSYLTEDSGEGTKIVRLIMSYNLLITQKNYS